MKKAGKILLAIIALLSVIRFAVLPPVVKSLINREIASHPGTTGGVLDVRLNLLRGRITLIGLKLQLIEPALTTTLEIPELETRIRWGALLHREIVAELELNKPHLAMVATKVSSTQKKQSAKRTQETVSSKIRRAPPFRIDLLTVRDGTLRYRDRTKTPDYELVVTQLQAKIENIANTRRLTDTLFARFDARALFMNSGKVHLSGKFNPLSRPSAFKLNLSVQGLAVETLNPILEAEKNIRIKHGHLSVASEVATKNDRVDGYIKPVIHDLQVSEFKKDIKQGLGHALKEQALNVIGQIAKNRPTDQQGTRVPFHGRLENPKANIGAAIGATLHNIFAKAIVPSIEHSVRLSKVG